eukprot:578130-Pleurochrysis_carterae.AAC.1
MRGACTAQRVAATNASACVCATSAAACACGAQARREGVSVRAHACWMCTKVLGCTRVRTR